MAPSVPFKALSDLENLVAEPSYSPPPSELECKVKRKAYLAAVEGIDVLKLASSYNNGRECVEFCSRTHGSFNVCVFVEFPADGAKWVVRFPICTLLYDAWKKLQCEVATLEYICAKTTIRAPKVKGSGAGDGLHATSTAKFPFIILEYIEGRPLNPRELLHAPPGTFRILFGQLGDALAQLRALEFEYGGALMEDDAGGWTIVAPNTVCVNVLQLQGFRRDVQRYTTALDFALCNYETLDLQLRLPMAGLEEDEVRDEVFALQDYKLRLSRFIDPALNLGPFVLTHGDLLPTNVIVNEDLTLAGIIDWEWSGTVPVQFFQPPLWLGGTPAVSPGDDSFEACYKEMYKSLITSTSSPASQTLAQEWGPDLASSPRLFLASALLGQSLFIKIYYTALLPEFFKGHDKHDKLDEFYAEYGKFREIVQKRMDASKLAALL